MMLGILANLRETGKRAELIVDFDEYSSFDCMNDVYVKNSGLKPQSVLEFLSTIKNAFIFCELKQAGYIREHF